MSDLPPEDQSQPEEPKALFEGTLQLSRHMDYFRNVDEFYAYHNLFGYVLRMSEDVLDFLEYFREAPRDAFELIQQFGAQFEDEQLDQFLSVFRSLACLLQSEDEESERLLDMYPMHARWILAHQAESGPVTLYTADNETRQHVRISTLDDWDSALWRAIDGERSVKELIELMRDIPGSPMQGLQERVLASLALLTHSDMQVLKMSAEKASRYQGRRHAMPPYLVSTMFYDRVTHILRSETPGPRVHIRGQRSEPIDPAILEADRLENRLSYLFREPHPALGGQSYGARVLDKLDELGAISSAPRILDLSADTGHLARTLIEQLAVKHPEQHAKLHYVLVAPDESIAQRQRETIEGLPLEHVVCDFGKVSEHVEGPFDLILCNEALGSLETLSVRRVTRTVEDEQDVDDDDVEEQSPSKAKETFIGEGSSVAAIFKYGLSLDDSPDDFLLTVGAFEVLSQIKKLLSGQGQALLIEFGELYRYPQRTNEEGGFAFSQHFGLLQQVAKRLGFQTQFAYLMDELDFDRNLPMFATTRSQFKALRQFFRERGVELERRAYTREDIEALLGEHGIGPELIELSFEKLEDRVLGLVMHAFKWLRLYRSVEL
ncbi:MAG: hypothetical protein RBU37_09545 [Myxococcota bacterium]|nr:hypothetical protein [Myxococcota bacterium]